MMPKFVLTTRCVFVALTWSWGLLSAPGVVVTSLSAQTESSLGSLHGEFREPPDSSRILMRWWWFGPSATKAEISRELEQMKAAGIGGVEIANLYALELDNTQAGFRNTPFLSAEHLDTLHFAAAEARRLGLRVDLTLGSGWPLGGPEIPVNEAAGKLRVESIKVEPGASSAQVPFVDAGEELIAAFLVPSGVAIEAARQTLPLPAPEGGRYHFSASQQPRSLICFLSSRTGMMVKRASVGADGLVLDHYDQKATEEHLRAVGDRLLSAFGDQAPYAVFSDSLEDYGSDWTPAFLTEFERRRGYDLRPHLLALVMDEGPETAAVRHDWGRTLTELADENFLMPIRDWAAEHHTLFRSQTYGYPPVTLYSNRFADLVEGEGKATFMMWREFSDTRLAASAGHLFHRPVISSETWTWLHSPAFRATPLDMKAEADLHFLQGINQLVGHGWPYSPEIAGEPGWRMYAAAALNEHNPWFMAMPDLARYLQRVSFTLRQGEPANDVALLLPNDDVWSTFKAGFQKRLSPTLAVGFDETGSNVTVDEQMDQALGKKVIAQVLDAGFNLDFIDADTIDNAGIPYKVLVLPSVDRLPLATYEKIQAFSQHGGIVIATGHTPATSPGLIDAERISARLKELSKSMFRGEVATAHFIEDETKLGEELRKAATPDMKLFPSMPEIGFIHRKLALGDLYFVANTGNQIRHVRAKFRDGDGQGEIWDAFSGEVHPLPKETMVNLDLEAYGSRIIFFSRAAGTAEPEPLRKETLKADLSNDWEVAFGKSGLQKTMRRLSSWDDDPATRYFSGRATYQKSFDFSPEAATRGTRFFLDLGEATTTAVPSPPGEHNMEAYLNAPVREAGEVYMNGKLAGEVWHPPYRVDVTALLRAGSNELRIVVGNTAMSELAGHALPDYRLLSERYGRLFEPQDMHDLQPLPSGLLGPVRLIESDVLRSSESVRSSETHRLR